MDSDSFSFTVSDSDSPSDDVGGSSSGKSVAPPAYPSPPSYAATTTNNEDDIEEKALISAICAANFVTFDLINAAPRGPIRNAALLARALADGTAGDNVQPWDHRCDDAIVRHAFYAKNEAAFPGLLEHFSPRSLEWYIGYILQYWSDKVGRSALLSHFQSHPELSIRMAITVHPLWAIAAHPDAIDAIAKIVYKNGYKNRVPQSYKEDFEDYQTLALVADQLVQNLKHVSKRTRRKYAKAMIYSRQWSVPSPPIEPWIPWASIRMLDEQTFLDVVTQLATTNSRVGKANKHVTLMKKVMHRYDIDSQTGRVLDTELTVCASFYTIQRSNNLTQHVFYSDLLSYRTFYEVLRTDDLVEPTSAAGIRYAEYWRVIHDPKSLHLGHRSHWRSTLTVRRRRNFILSLPLDGEENGVAAHLLMWAATHPRHPKRYIKHVLNFLKCYNKRGVVFFERYEIDAVVQLAYTKIVSEQGQNSKAAQLISARLP